jgi:tetratricopeptide (TPR) repeat protein
MTVDPAGDEYPGGSGGNSGEEFGPMPPDGSPPPGVPSGEAYDWFRRGERLLAEGNAAAAAQLLQRVLDADPSSRSARESLARALFDARRYAESRALFADIVAHHPADDYALFGLGLSALRSGDAEGALEPLSLAVAMKPSDRHYATALRAARVRARGEVGPVLPGHLGGKGATASSNNADGDVSAGAGRQSDEPGAGDRRDGGLG